MALYDLNRAGDTPIATLMVSDIVPKNWHKFPPPVAQNTPIYVPVVAFTGGAVGDDVSVATANATGAFTPHNQAEKAAAMGTTLAVDIGRRRGYLEPDDPYPVAATPVPVAPAITSLAPNTASVGAPTLSVLINGTGFTPWSSVRSGNYPIPFKYISPTQLQIYEKPWASVAGTVTVIVTDHNVDSNASNFVFT